MRARGELRRIFCVPSKIQLADWVVVIWHAKLVTACVVWNVYWTAGTNLVIASKTSDSRSFRKKLVPGLVGPRRPICWAGFRSVLFDSLVLESRNVRGSEIHLFPWVLFFQSARAGYILLISSLFLVLEILPMPATVLFSLFLITVTGLQSTVESAKSFGSVRVSFLPVQSNCDYFPCRILCLCLLLCWSWQYLSRKHGFMIG